MPLEQEPPPLERPLRIPGFENPQPRSARSAPVPSSPEAAPPAAEPSPTIRGSVRLAEGVSAAPRGVLFLIARSAAGGPPLAVKRLPAEGFPIAFEIGQADVMMAGLRFEGPLRLTARLDSDGDASTRGESDLLAELASPVEPGASDVALELRPGGG